MIISSIQEFYEFFQNGMPILSIDYGGKKLGVAISTPDHSFSMALQMISTESEKEKFRQVLNIAEEKNICAIVIGWPVNMDGSKSDQTLIVERFAARLEGRTKLPIFLQDERLTSKAADNLLKKFGVKRKDRNSRDDMTAASMILETTLESIKRL
ncbi:MAG: Holliday junction resolvase RuvX [Rickettsiales bacterium]|nr:MAG: Holliday junction resolvase RuvX [Rickettsiales bacterium]